VELDRAYDLIEAMQAIAAGKTVAGKPATVAQVALAWLLYQPVVTTVIVGAKRPTSSPTISPPARWN
jgi:aryl-alcohol dehydrogenase-like predicted oxidoreductase